MGKKVLRYTWLNGWTVIATLIFLMVSIPAWTLVIHIFDPSGPQWSYVINRLLTHYVPSTLLLLGGVSCLTLILGIGAAWIVSAYKFPGRKLFEWLLILPLSFPAYMMGYSYVGILEYTGPVHTFLRNTLEWNIRGPILDIMNIWGAIFILSMSLFPYLYVVCRTSFLMRSRDLLDAATISGSSKWQSFWKVAIPMARPAVIGGLALIGMEVLNDYGTVKYFGVDTFTTGIFRSWFSMGDISTGIRLSSILMLFVITLLWLERGQRGRRAFAVKTGLDRPATRSQLGYLGAIVAVGFCTIICLLSFVFPFAQQIYWVWNTSYKVVNTSFWIIAINSLGLALSAALLTVAMATVLLYAARINRISWLQYVSQLSILGYAIPGAIIAIGIYIPMVKLDEWIFGFIGEGKGLYLSQTVFMLVFAYIVRFMAVAYHSVSAGFQRVGPHITEASLVLGNSLTRTFYKIDIPSIRNSLGAATLLVFVDTIKELPLTLILRPFNFHTLATKAFDMATNEQIAESANASLLVVIIGMLPIIVLNKLMNRNGYE